MKVSVNLVVKGTRHYKAGELLRKGSLSSGVAIRLEHQPDNPHDRNAVAVLVRRTGAMLGHVSRDLAPKYAELVSSGKIVEATIANVSEERGYININIQVVYEQSEEELAQKHNSLLWQSASSMPSTPGVYAIRNNESGRQYVGSSNNIQNRIQSHIRDLSLGCHANHALQSDFSCLGANRFEAQVLVGDVSTSSLSSVESDHISSLLNKGVSLYNLTADGQGIGFRPRDNSKSEPISDRFARQRVEEERRRADSILSEKRKKIYEAFEPRFEALLPNTSFWVYFTATFVGVLIMLLILVSKIKDRTLLILSAITSFVISPFIRSYFQKKARQKPKYQELLKECDEQLAALVKERNSQNL